MSFAKHNYFQWRIQGGGHGGPVPPFWDYFFTKAKFTNKISTKRAQNLSQNAGNGHFRDSNFQKILGESAPRPP